MPVILANTVVATPSGCLTAPVLVTLLYTAMSLRGSDARSCMAVPPQLSSAYHSPPEDLVGPSSENWLQDVPVQEPANFCRPRDLPWIRRRRTLRPSGRAGQACDLRRITGYGEDVRLCDCWRWTWRVRARKSTERRLIEDRYVTSTCTFYSVVFLISSLIVLLIEAGNDETNNANVFGTCFAIMIAISILQF
jgi:hypothetical protein